MIFCAWVDSCLPCQELLIPPLKRFPFILKGHSMFCRHGGMCSKRSQCEGRRAGEPTRASRPQSCSSSRQAVTASPPSSQSLLRFKCFCCQCAGLIKQTRHIIPNQQILCHGDLSAHYQTESWFASPFVTANFDVPTFATIHIHLSGTLYPTLRLPGLLECDPKK